VRFTTPPKIDGDLSDPAWQTAAKTDYFVDWLNGNKNIDQTVVSIGFDDQNMYLAFYAYDSKPDEITAKQTKRGSPLDGDDIIILNLDPFHSHKWNDVSFFNVNALGTRYARLQGGRATKLEWEGDWQAASKRMPDGWTCEIAIPWAILNHPQVKGPTTCGINFLRFQKRTNMISNWCNIGPNDAHPENMGHWVDVVFPPFKRHLSLLPYASPDWRGSASSESVEGDAKAPNGSRSHQDFGIRAGLDARYTLTPGLTAVGTIHPDFQSVESAVEGIDFSYGERYVPDRRPFFQEGGNIYGTGGIVGNYYYSQRIPDFDVGTNVYGKLTDRDTLGVLTALDFNRRSDYLVRTRHELGALSNVNIAFVGHEAGPTSNQVCVFGEDFRRGNWSADASWAPSWERGKQVGSAGNIFFTYQSPRWYGSIVPNYVSPRFKDELGFIPFEDFKGVHAELSHNREWRKGPLRDAWAGISTDRADRYNGDLFRRQVNFWGGFNTRKDFGLRLNWNGGRFEEFNDSVFGVGLQFRNQDPFHNFGIGYSWGHQAGDPITFLTPSVTWRFGQRFTVGLASAILNHTEDAYQHIFTFNYDFSPERGFGGRIISQTGGTGGYLAYRQSGYGGVERWFILGDPNSKKFRKRILTKVVWPL
jgi:hypothetical protein